jgi:predicted DNA-binding transcriptional regulator YafY
MRADRLISIVMMLQTHERMTAQDLAQELEVSQRTIYRDVTALNSAGIPIYTDRGPSGGISLLESYRTTLTGMSEEEAQALFMMNIPQALVELGIGQKLKSALLKLAAAMPPSQQSMQAHTQQRVYLDSTPWEVTTEPAPHLGVLHEAVWQDRRVCVVFRGSFEAEIELELEPYGLVAKMNTWYLVARADGYHRVLKVGDIIEVEAHNDHFERDESFDLAAYWKVWCSDSLSRQPEFKVRLRMAPGLINKLKFYLDETIKYTIIEDTTADQNGWEEVCITYDNFFQARQSILNFGRAAEVLEPTVLKISVIDFARQIHDFYQAKSL